MKADTTLLQKLQNRAILKPRKHSYINIAKKKASYFKLTPLIFEKRSFSAQILNRYRMGFFQISSEYFQLLSYFAKPQKKVQAIEALRYKEKYFKIKEAYDLSETILNKRDKEHEKKISLFQREYFKLKTEYIVQTNSLESKDELEKKLLIELQVISTLKVSEIERLVEQLYVQKANIETNPYGPKQIAALIKNSANAKEKKEFITLYKEFEQLQVPQSYKSKDSETSAESINEQTRQVERMERKIFTRIQELLVESNESRLVSKKDAETTTIQRFYKTLTKNKTLTRENFTLLEKFLPMLQEQSVAPYRLQEITTLLKNGANAINKKEFVTLYKEFEQLQALQKDEFKSAESKSGEPTNEQTRQIEIERMEKRIFTRIQELLVESNESRLVSKKDAETTTIQRFYKTLTKNKTLTRENFTLLEKFLPALERQSVAPAETTQRYLSTTQLKSAKEKQLSTQSKNETKISVLLELYKTSTGLEKEKSIVKIKEFLYKIKLTQIKNANHAHVLTPIERKKIAKEFERKISKLLTRIKETPDFEAKTLIDALQNKDEIKSARAQKDFGKEKYQEFSDRLYKIISQDVKEQTPTSFISIKQKQAIHREILKDFSRQKDLNAITPKDIELIRKREISRRKSVVALNQEEAYKHVSRMLKVENPFILLTLAQKKEMRKSIKNMALTKRELSTLNLKEIKKEFLNTLQNERETKSLSKQRPPLHEIKRFLLQAKETSGAFMKPFATLQGAATRPSSIATNKKNINNLNHDGVSLNFIDFNKSFKIEDEVMKQNENMRFISAKIRNQEKKKENASADSTHTDENYTQSEEVRKEIMRQEITQTIFEQKTNVEQHVNVVMKNFDARLDELALKIFRDIKDEMNIEYKRL